MQFSEKLTELRRRRGLSQEQLADFLGVTRQSVSKWESGSVMPELGKLIALSDLFHVTVDALVKDRLDLPDPDQAGHMEENRAARLEAKMDDLTRYMRGYSYDSKTQLFGLPLVSIRLTRRGFWGRDSVARGIIAIGNAAVGVVAIGAYSVGILSIGALSVGLLSLGALAAGVGALGAVAVGAAAFGSCAKGNRRRRGRHGRDRRGTGGSGGACPLVGQRTDPPGGGVVFTELPSRSLAAAAGRADVSGRPYQVTSIGG